MRRLTLVLLFGFTCLAPAVAAADSEPRPRTEGRAARDNGAVEISNPGATSPGEAEAAPRGRRVSTGPGGPVPEHVITSYQFRGPLNADDTCIYSVTSRSDTPMTGSERFMNDGLLNYAAESGIPTCEELDAAAAAPSPAQVAEAFLRTIPLPAPQPSIAPDGQAITGLSAFLETNGSLAHTVGPSETALGPIVVEAASVYWVDWGDGSPEAGPFAFEGEAYPAGRIYHGYRHRGDYTVTVRQAWGAEWRLGADSGSVEGLVTEASIPLHVDEVQAVIR